VSAPANLPSDDEIQGSVNWVGEEPRLAWCVCDYYQQAINTRAAPRFLVQPMQYSPVCGHTGSQCFDEGDRGNLADRWLHGTRVGTRVGHMWPGYPSTRVLTSLVRSAGIKRSENLTCARSDSDSCVAAPRHVRLTDAIITVWLTASISLPQ